MFHPTLINCKSIARYHNAFAFSFNQNIFAHLNLRNFCHVFHNSAHNFPTTITQLLEILMSML